jgi:hypothetical protein
MCDRRGFGRPARKVWRYVKWYYWIEEAYRRQKKYVRKCVQSDTSWGNFEPFQDMGKFIQNASLPPFLLKLIILWRRFCAVKTQVIISRSKYSLLWDSIQTELDFEGQN